MAKLLDKLFNRVIEGELLELSEEEISNLGLAKASQVPYLTEAVNLGALVTVYDDEGETPVYRSHFDKEITEAQFNAIKDSGLVIIMFNTTVVIVPFVKNQTNRFIANAVYDSNGNSMAVRGALTFSDDTTYNIHIELDDKFAEQVYDSGITPYAIIKYLYI